MANDPAFLELTAVARLIRRKKISALELTRHCLARSEAWQPQINAFIEVEAEKALETARRLDQLLARGAPRGPLHGIPLAHKDMFYRRGALCSCGSAIRRNWVAPYDSTVASRLESAGAVTLGRLNMSEFAAHPAGANHHYGDCLNPWSTAHIAGGSSSGSAAAVAARLVYGSIGSDTGGSIRVPAALNGVCGLMPTYGRVSRYGAMPRAWSLDHIGPIARSAADCALLLDVIAGHDPRDGNSAAVAKPNYSVSSGRSIKGLRVGVLSYRRESICRRNCKEQSTTAYSLSKLPAPS